MQPGMVRFVVQVGVLTVLFGCGGSSSGLSGGTSGGPELASVSPNPAPRGTLVTVFGIDLNGANTTAYFVRNGITQSAIASYGDSSKITVTVPSNLSAGTYSVYAVTTDSGGSASSASNQVKISVN